MLSMVYGFRAIIIIIVIIISLFSAFQRKCFGKFMRTMTVFVGDLNVDQCNVKIGCKSDKKRAILNDEKKIPSRRTMRKMGENNGK